MEKVKSQTCSQYASKQVNNMSPCQFKRYSKVLFKYKKMNTQGFSMYKEIHSKYNLNLAKKSVKLPKKSPFIQFMRKVKKNHQNSNQNLVSFPLNQKNVTNFNTVNSSQEFKSKKKIVTQNLGLQMPRISYKGQNFQTPIRRNLKKNQSNFQLIPLTTRKSNVKPDHTYYTMNVPFGKRQSNADRMKEIMKQNQKSLSNFQQTEATTNTSTANQYAFTNNASTQQSLINIQDVSQEGTSSRLRVKSQKSLRNIIREQNIINESTPEFLDPQKIWESLQLPIGPGHALKLFRENLTDYEQSEILDYKQVYYLALPVNKIKADLTNKNNFGFDDDKGFYLPISKDQVAYRYELIEMLGKGSFAQVLRCFDHKLKKYVALKIIRNKERFHQQAQIEIKILEYIKQKDSIRTFNVVHAQDYLIFRRHVIIVFELYSMNLYELIRINNYKGFPQSLIKKFSQQLLMALKFMRKETIIHCDLKPENIVLLQPTRSLINVIDFGSACFLDEKLYAYIQSRFYRAPEIILSYPSYDTQIDMWSFGCIIAELHSGKPLFPGESEAEQFSLICEIKGLPPKEFIDSSPKKKLFFDENGEYKVMISKKGQVREPNSKSLALAVHSNDETFLNFIENCLHYDPQKRFTPKQALQHPWMADYQEKEISPKKFQGSYSTRDVSGSTIGKKIVNKDINYQAKTEKHTLKKKIQLSKISLLTGNKYIKL